MEDLDGDSHKDLIALETGSLRGDINWYKNEEGTGSFTLAISVAKTSLDSTCMTMADLNDDGSMDLLNTSLGNHGVHWYPNLDGNGDYRYQHRAPNFIPYFNPMATFPLDIDNDNDIDLITSTLHGIYISENTDGYGDFEPLEEIYNNFSDGVLDMHVIDLDADGDQDIIFANDSGEVLWMENTDGLGNFNTASIIIYLFTSIELILPFDMNGDNLIDIALIDNTSSYKLKVLENNGDATFTVTDVSNEIGEPGDLISGDINNDGTVDLLASGNNVGGNVIWWLNQGNSGEFNEGVQLSNSYGASDRNIALALIDGDNLLDLVYQRNTNNNIRWAKNTGNGFTDSESFLLSDITTGTTGIIAEDVDGDTDVDIIVSFGFSTAGYIRWCENGRIILDNEVSDPPKDQRVQIFPNPSDNILNIASEFPLQKIEFLT